jgi:protein ImuB
MRRIVSIWFPAFAVERFIRGRMKSGRPSPPKGLPFALVEAGRKGLRLAAVSATATSFGLMRGQRLADARAAVPDLLCEPHDAEADMASLLGLCRWLERYSPWVSPEPPDGALLDCSGVAHLFGGEAAMLADMKKRLAAYGFTARVAIAETIGAAWGHARYKGARLEDLPIESLRIDTEAARTLRRLGLKTVGALLEIPRASLARRFRGETVHENVLIRLDEMLGRREEPLNPLNPPTSFIAHRALMEPVITPEGLETVLTGLAMLLARDLEQKGKGATRLILKLFRTDGTRASVPAGLSAPSADPAHLLRLLKPKLENFDAGYGIDAMTLEARETGPLLQHQYGFMEETTDTGLGQLNDRVMNRYETEIAALAAVESHIPERAEIKSNCHPGESQDPSLAHAPNPPWVPAFAGMTNRTGSIRPFLIFERPEQTAVIAAVPDGPPMRFTWRRVTRKVARSEGPERVAPEWWRLADGERPRDYYMIEDEQGRRYWLYREGLYGEPGETQPKWFVHGLSA